MSTPDLIYKTSSDSHANKPSRSNSPLNRTKYKPIFTYRLDSAINDRIVCDYQINLPEIMVDGETKKMDELSKETLALQVRFLLDGLLMTGSRRTIAMASTILQCAEFEKALMDVAVNYHGIKPIIYTVTSETSRAELHKILDDFGAEGEDDVIKMILHLGIFAETIDVPRCDSVYLIKANFANGTKPVQAMFRANRRLNSYPNKVANVFIWTDEKEDLVSTFTLLREVDTSFIKKIGIIGRDYDIQADKEVRKCLAEKTKLMRQFFTVKCVE